MGLLSEGPREETWESFERWSQLPAFSIRAARRALAQRLA